MIKALSVEKPTVKVVNFNKQHRDILVWLLDREGSEISPKPVPWSAKDFFKRRANKKQRFHAFKVAEFFIKQRAYCSSRQHVGQKAPHVSRASYRFRPQSCQGAKTGDRLRIHGNHVDTDRTPSGAQANKHA